MHKVTYSFRKLCFVSQMASLNCPLISKNININIGKLQKECLNITYNNNSDIKQLILDILLCAYEVWHTLFHLFLQILHEGGIYANPTYRWRNWTTERLRNSLCHLATTWSTQDFNERLSDSWTYTFYHSIRLHLKYNLLGWGDFP